MANMKNQLVYVLGTLLQYAVNLLNFYFSILFFLILVFDEAIHGKTNIEMKDKFIEYINKVIEIPETVHQFLSKDNLQKRFNFHNIF